MVLLDIAAAAAAGGQWMISWNVFTRETLVRENGSITLWLLAVSILSRPTIVGETNAIGSHGILRVFVVILRKLAAVSSIARHGGWLDDRSFHLRTFHGARV